MRLAVDLSIPSIAVLGGVRGPFINLSASTLLENSAQGTAVGTLSVVGGTGTYTFTLTDTAGSRFKVAGTNGVNLQAGATASTAGSQNITVHADNGAGSTLDRTFGITVTEAAVGPSAPVLAITSDETDANPDFTIAVDDTVGAGDVLHLQVQVSGGDWSSLVSDTTHTITSGEDAANEIDLSLSPLDDASYDARVNVSNGAVSDWSNVVTFSISVAAAGAALTYIGQIANDDGTGTLSSLLNLGTAPNTLVVVAGDTFQGAITGATIGASAMTQDGSTQSSSSSYLASAIYSNFFSTGPGSVTIAVALTGAEWVARSASVWIITNPTSTTVVQAAGFNKAGGAYTPSSPTVAVTAGDFMLGSTAQPATFDLTGMTQAPSNTYSDPNSTGNAQFDLTVLATNPAFALASSKGDMSASVGVYH